MQIFHVVYTFSEACRDFVLQGIFSNNEDAVKLAKEINPTFKEVAADEGIKIWVVQQTLADIVKYLTPEGPTLRDHFAMSALQGALADSDVDSDVDEMADWSYQQADAMLKARVV